MNCPHCGAEDSIEVLVDAWAVYRFTGFDDLGQAKVTQEEQKVRVDEFDDAHAQCSQCGERVEQSDVTEQVEYERLRKHIEVQAAREDERLRKFIESQRMK